MIPPPGTIEGALKGGFNPQGSGILGHDFPGHPDGKSPNDRATKAGFKGKVSENVTDAKDAQNAFDKWYKAAEHHRNMVRNNHAVAGVGHAGEKWCENFSSDTE